MEHAYSTAIDVNADRLAKNPDALADVTSHEFFHLWNVKRIRPQSLQPIDYTKENYTRALWFSEGVTSTVAAYIRMRAGLVDEPRFLRGLAAQIQELQWRPAHLTQSAEESSLDAWLEKYDYYALPQRSISYYNKGYLLGVLLDLEVRQATADQASLRDVFHWMNDHYAKPGRYFPDSAGVETAAEAVCRCSLQQFFNKYVAGTDEIPWDEFLKQVGLHTVQTTQYGPYLGFYATQNFNSPPTVSWISGDSDARRAGLAVGDAILQINGHDAVSEFGQELARLHPGDTLLLHVRTAGAERDIRWKLGSQQQVEFELKDVSGVTREQKARRVAWMRGNDEAAGAHP